MISLITGGCGFTGRELAKTLLERGEKTIVFDLSPNRSPAKAYNENLIEVRGNIANEFEIFNAVRENRVDTIFHLAALLSVPSEANPWSSINVNALGTYYVLEAARLFNVKRVIFTSSIGAYGVTHDTVVTEDTVQRPKIIYGVTKVFGELLGLYYNHKFGIDFRGVRFPQLVGPGITSEGVGQYNPLLIEAAIKGEAFDVWVPQETIVPMIYIKDAIRSLIMLNDAPQEKIKTRIYNVGQISPPPTAKDLVDAVKRFYPEARINFRPDPAIVNILRTIPKVIEGEKAKEEWGWHISYSLEDMVNDFIENYPK